MSTAGRQIVPFGLITLVQVPSPTHSEKLIQLDEGYDDWQEYPSPEQLKQEHVYFCSTYCRHHSERKPVNQFPFTCKLLSELHFSIWLIAIIFQFNLAHFAMAIRCGQNHIDDENMLKTYYYISQFVRVLWLVNLAGRILLYGLLKIKAVFAAKMLRDLSSRFLNLFSK